MRFLGLLILSMVVQQLLAKPDGAPDTAAVCDSMAPGHRSPPQTSPVPFVINLSQDYYSRSTTTLKVYINATTSRKFRGFLIQGRRADWTLSSSSRKEPIGFFVVQPGTKHVCTGTNGVALTHTEGSPGSDEGKSFMEILWDAPKVSQGHVQFWITIVSDYDTYWVTEKSAIVYDRDAPPLPKTTKPPVPVGLDSPRIDTADCGKSKGCYRNPENCVEAGCNIIVTWKYVDSGVNFELSANTEGWVAVGFSDDKKMGDDDVYECVWNEASGSVEVRQSYNEDKSSIIKIYNPPVLMDVEQVREDGRLRCRFRRPFVSSVSSELADFSEPKHILLAKGKVDDKGNKERHVLEPNKYPYVSKQKVVLTDTDYVSIHDTARYWMVKFHGCLMLLAWMLCAPLALILAKYYKLMWPNRRVCGEPYWFAIHRACMVVTFFATIIAFIIIFVHAWGYSKMPELPDKAHPILGIIVTICVFVNPFISLCRCDPKSSKRPIFNWIHWFFGTVGSVLAVPALFIGLNLHKAFVPWWATWVLVAFMLFHLIIELMLEIHGCINGKKQKYRTEEFEMRKKGTDSRGDYLGLLPKPVGSHFKNRILVVYLVVAIILTIVMIITVAVC